MKKLSPSQEKYLKSLAHHIDPVVIVGHHGVTDDVLKSIDEAIEKIELIKIKFNKFKSDKKELSNYIVEKLNIHLVSNIGNIAILFKQNKDKEKRKIIFDK